MNDECGARQAVGRGDPHAQAGVAARSEPDEQRGQRERPGALDAGLRQETGEARQEVARVGSGALVCRALGQEHALAHGQRQRGLAPRGLESELHGSG